VPATTSRRRCSIETLDALARLDYADFEVLVIDNNTLEEAVWRPVEAHCAQLGARFRFFHVAPLAASRPERSTTPSPAPRRTPKIVAVIDSDYVVDARWLRDLMPVSRMRGLRSCRRRRLPRRGPERLQGHVLRRVPRLLPHRHDHRNERNAIIQPAP